MRWVSTAYIMRLFFALIGVLFILLFTASGIYQIVFTLVNCSGDIVAFIVGNGSIKHWQAIIGAFKQSLGVGHDSLVFLSFLVFLHGALGVYYAVFTKYNRFKENLLFYMQILSSIAAAFVIMLILSPNGEASAHSGFFWIISILIAGLGSFHIGNGLYNAGITLGISVTQQTKYVIKAISWVIAVISFLKIIILFV